MEQYLPVAVMLGLATAFAGLSFLASTALSPRRPNAAKAAPYESGIVPEVGPSERFPVRFYLVAMVFIIFDIEIIFLYPWAVVFRRLELFGLVEMVVFVLAVFVSFVYLVSNGALDWSPGRRLLGPTATSPDPERTATSTVRRISRPSAGRAA